MQGIQVHFLVQEDPTCHRATKLMHLNYWSPSAWSLCSREAAGNEKPSHCSGEQPLLAAARECCVQRHTATETQHSQKVIICKKDHPQTFPSVIWWKKDIWATLSKKDWGCRGVGNKRWCLILDVLPWGTWGQGEMCLHGSRVTLSTMNVMQVAHVSLSATWNRQKKQVKLVLILFLLNQIHTK